MMASTSDYTDYTGTIDYSMFATICENSYVMKIIRVLQPCVYSLVFILGLVGNCLVLTVYVFHRKMKSMSDIYFLNLAIADLLFVFTLPFLAASSVHGWIFSVATCKLVKSLYSMTFYSGFLFLTCISVDRYIAIVRATLAHRLRTKAVYYSKVTCLFVWLLSSLISLPQAIYSQVSFDHKVCWMRYPDQAIGWMRVGAVIVQMVIGFLIPLLVMLFCYSVIIWTLLQARNSEKHKAFKVILAVVVTFVVFQTPFNIVSILETTDTMSRRQMDCDESNRRDIILQVTSCLAYSRFCLNPILYAFVGVRFRKDVLHLLQSCGCDCTRHVGSRGRYSRRSTSSNVDIVSSFGV